MLGMNYVIDTTARTFYVPEGCVFPNVFHIARSKSGSQLHLCASLNSTFAQLVINISGRANLGGGALKIEMYEFESIQIVDPALLPELDAGIFVSEEWDAVRPSESRRALDSVVFNALGLTAGEREDVYAGVALLVGDRKRRARSL